MQWLQPKLLLLLLPILLAAQPLEMRVVLTFPEYDACIQWEQLLLLQERQQMELLGCASLGKCYGRRLVLNVQRCGSDVRTLLQDVFPRLAAIEPDEVVMAGEAAVLYADSGILANPYLSSDASASFEEWAATALLQGDSSSSADPLWNWVLTSAANISNGSSLGDPPPPLTSYAELLSWINAAMANSTEASTAMNATIRNPSGMEQWNLQQIGVPSLWQSHGLGGGVVVGLLDSGVAATALPAFGGRLLQGMDFISDPAVALDGDGRDPNPLDPGDTYGGQQCDSGQAASSWHGTYVASVLAASQQLPEFSGVAPEALVLPLRVLGRCKMGFASDVADALAWAIGAPIEGMQQQQQAKTARAIVMPFTGRGSCPSYLQSVITLAVQQYGVYVYAAAGNEGGDAADNFPANCAGVISVGATDRAGQPTAYSAANASVYMPGGTLQDPVPCVGPTMQVGGCVGTSLAVPHAGGIRALVTLVQFPGNGSDDAAASAADYDVVMVHGANAATNISGRAESLALGGSHACAILSSRWIKCWGMNGAGQLGLGSSAAFRGQAAGEMGDSLPYVDLGSSRFALQVSAGANHTCAVLDNRLVKCWGSNTFGRLGLGNDTMASWGSAAGQMGDSLPYTSLGTGRTALQVACGGSHTCVLLDNRRVKCWGLNANGELGYGDVENRGDAPGEMGDALPYVDLDNTAAASVLQISAGLSHTCALLSSGGIKCWGLGANGRLGYTNTESRGDGPNEMGTGLPLVNVGPLAAVQVSCGAASTCVLLEGGSVKCWGNNQFGALGYGNTNQVGGSPADQGVFIPSVQLGTGVAARQLASGWHQTCALIDSSSLIKCWGNNQFGSLGLGDTSHRGDGAGEMGDSLPYVSLGTFVSAQSVSVGEGFACALLGSFDVKCWGRGDRLGLGTATTMGDGAGEMGDSLAAVSLGSTTASAVTAFCSTDLYYSTATAKCQSCPSGFFSSASGSLQCTACPAAQSICGYEVVATSIQASMGSHTCALIGSGLLLPKCWGSNEAGQLGIGSASARMGDALGSMGNALPLASLGTGRTARQISVGMYHSCAVLDNSGIKCWGQGTYGQLGFYTNATAFGVSSSEMGNSLPAVDLGSGRTARVVSAGAFFTCAIMDNSQAKCWGRNLYGALGLGDTTDRGVTAGYNFGTQAAISFGTSTTVARLFTGWYHSCVILHSGSAKCWGYNAFGQLGLGHSNSMGDNSNEMGNSLPVVSLGTSPTRVARQISIGMNFTCAVLDNALVKCWGYNAAGQLGLGDTATRGAAANQMGNNLSYVDLGTNRTAKQVAAGTDFACALLDNSLIKCWGGNSEGQLGLGDTVQRGDGPGEMGDALPYVNLGPNRTAANMTAGSGHACALLDNGYTKCWGSNGAGQLGLGLLVAQYSPVASTIDIGTLSCMQCDSGFYAQGVCSASNNQSNCSFCRPGTYAGDGGLTCNSCPIGKYSELEGAMFDWACTSCSAGTQSQTAGSSSCSLCPLGTYSLGGGGGGDTACSSCPAGTYSQSPGAYSPECTPCTQGTYSHAAGATDPTACTADLQTAANVSVSRGGFTCAVLSNGGVKCWGLNSWGQLGLGDTINRMMMMMGDALPYVNLGTDAKVQAVATGNGAACVLLRSGSVKCWGSNAYGQLGLQGVSALGSLPEHMGDNLQTINLGTGRTAVQLSFSEHHVCAVLDNGSVKCWGRNDDGQLGLGDTNNRGDDGGEMGDALPAVDLGAGLTAIQVSAGASHTCALLNTRRFKCWGGNAFGQLGYGDTRSRGDNPNEMGANLTLVRPGATDLRWVHQVSAGRDMTCALMDTGNIKCFGRNNVGQLGIGSNNDRGDNANELGDVLPNVFLGTGRTVKRVSAQGNHACAILDNDLVKCWGTNDYGQLGIGDTRNRGDTLSEIDDALPYAYLGTGRTARHISVGVNHTCAILDNWHIKCWGANDVGQLGFVAARTTTTSPPAATVDVGRFVCTPCPAGTYVSIRCNATSDNVCSNCPAGTYWTVEAGINASASCAPCPAGTYSATSVASSSLCEACPIGTYSHSGGATSSAVCVTKVQTTKTVSASVGMHSCALMDNGYVKCWGSNDMGQLGLGDSLARAGGGDALPYVQLGPGLSALSIATGHKTSCALLGSSSSSIPLPGVVKCWGSNDVGELGTGSTEAQGTKASDMGSSLQAIDLGAGRSVRQLSMAGVHACVLLDNYMVKCWGWGSFGQLGIGNVDNMGDQPGEMGDALPYVDLGTGRSAKQVSTGLGHSCVLLDTNQIRCWGFNNEGQLGLDSTVQYTTRPSNSSTVALGTGLSAKQVVAGGDSTCAVLSNNLLKCWGKNNVGQLGIGSTASRGADAAGMGSNLPAVSLGTGRTVLQVSVGLNSACALLDNSLVKCWGSNEYGQLGIGDTANRGDDANEMGDALPYVDLGWMRTAKHISVGDFHACALLDNSRVKCWGNNNVGQLGITTTTMEGQLLLFLSSPPAATVDFGFFICTPCISNWYQTADCNAFSDVACEQCSVCTPGQYTSRACGPSSNTACRPCAPGTFSVESGLLACTPCEAGRFAALEGSTNCLTCLCQPCAPGSFSAAIGATSCEACQSGSHAPIAGRTSCLKCSVGYYS